MGPAVLSVDNQGIEDADEVPFFHTLERIVRTKYKKLNKHWLNRYEI